MKVILCLNGSWIVTGLIESLFHFHEVLLHVGIWELGVCMQVRKM